MARHEQSIQVVGTKPEAAFRACRQAVADMQWKVLDDDGESCLVVQEVGRFNLWFYYLPAKVRLTIKPSRRGSWIDLKGSSLGLGPVQKRHLVGQMGAIVNRVQLLTQR